MKTKADEVYAKCWNEAWADNISNQLVKQTLQKLEAEVRKEKDQEMLKLLEKLYLEAGKHFTGDMDWRKFKEFYKKLSQSGGNDE